jgi:hypothetical protein
MIADLFKAKLAAKPAKRTGLREGSPVECADESSECRILVNRCGDAEDEGFQPRRYHRLAFAALSVGIILWNAVKLYR